MPPLRLHHPLYLRSRKSVRTHQLLANKRWEFSSIGFPLYRVVESQKKPKSHVNRFSHENKDVGLSWPLLKERVYTIFSTTMFLTLRPHIWSVFIPIFCFNAQFHGFETSTHLCLVSNIRNRGDTYGIWGVHHLEQNLKWFILNSKISLLNYAYFIHVLI